MIDKEHGELKLTFERKFNYEGKDVAKSYLNSFKDSELFIKDMKRIYNHNLREFEGTHNGYYEAINRKLHFLEDLE